MNYILRFFKKYIEIYYKMVKLNNDNKSMVFLLYAAKAAEVVSADDFAVSAVFGIASIGVADSGAWGTVYDVDGNVTASVWASQSASGVYTVDEKKPVLSEIRDTVNSNIIFSSSTSSWNDGGLDEKSHTGNLSVKIVTEAEASALGYSPVAIKKAMGIA